MLVTGYGYCGKAIAKRLGALGARVTVLARRKEARKEAKGDGFYAVDFAFGPEEAMGAAMVVNTVPALVVTEKIIRELPRDAYIVDIASGEGGTDFAFARDCVMYKKWPETDLWIKMILWGIVSFLIGYYVFSKKENNVMQKI